jgi:Fe-S-cluster containining protein
MDELDELLESAGDAQTPPPLPSGGIPTQYLPLWIRWLLRTLILPFLWLDLFAQFIARQIIRPPYKKGGECKRRGNCCHNILVKKSRGVFKFLDLFWHQEVNGFYLREKKTYIYNGMKVYRMGCRYLKENGQCSVYFFRPMLCRTWPRIEYFGRPQVLKGCGYYPKARKKGVDPLKILN